MKFYSGLKGPHKSIGVILTPDIRKHSKEFSIETTHKDSRYWGYRYEESFYIHTFGFYFFELCYYA